MGRDSSGRTAARAVFLDRDGCVIRDEDYLRDPAGVRLMPGAAKAMRGLRAAGFRLFVATNQSAVARGMLSEAGLGRIHARMNELLAKAGAALDGIYYCPHLPEGGAPEYARECECRKPAPGMLLRAAREHGLDLGASFMVGDSERDVEAGLRAGCRAILLAPDTGVTTRAERVCGNLEAAGEYILGFVERRK